MASKKANPLDAATCRALRAEMEREVVRLERAVVSAQQRLERQRAMLEQFDEACLSVQMSAARERQGGGADGA